MNSDQGRIICQRISVGWGRRQTTIGFPGSCFMLRSFQVSAVVIKNQFFFFFFYWDYLMFHRPIRKWIWNFRFFWFISIQILHHRSSIITIHFVMQCKLPFINHLNQTRCPTNSGGLCLFSYPTSVSNVCCSHISHTSGDAHCLWWCTSVLTSHTWGSYISHQSGGVRLIISHVSFKCLWHVNL